MTLSYACAVKEFPSSEMTNCNTVLNDATVWFFSVATLQYSITRPPDMLATSAIASFEGLCRAFILYFSKKDLG